MATPKTWEDVKSAAVVDPLLRHVVHMVETGICTREQALIAAVLHQNETIASMMRIELERLSTEIRPIILKMEPK